jgi:hypothetical protein
MSRHSNTDRPFLSRFKRGAVPADAEQRELYPYVQGDADYLRHVLGIPADQVDATERQAADDQRVTFRAAARAVWRLGPHDPAEGLFVAVALEPARVPAEQIADALNQLANPDPSTGAELHAIRRTLGLDDQSSALDAVQHIQSQRRRAAEHASKLARDANTQIKAMAENRDDWERAARNAWTDVERLATTNQRMAELLARAAALLDGQTECGIDHDDWCDAAPPDPRCRVPEMEALLADINATTKADQ